MVFLDNDYVIYFILTHHTHTHIIRYLSCEFTLLNTCAIHIFYIIKKKQKKRKKERECTQQPYLVNERSNEYHALIMYKLNINLFNKLINVNVELKHNVLYTENKQKKNKTLKKNNKN